MFASTTFGGEPLRVLANVDEELGAAHMGPRIYKRHNQKHVRNRVRAKIDASHSSGASSTPIATAKAVTSMEHEEGRKLGSSSTADRAALSLEEKDLLRSVDLQKLVDECRRCHNLSAVQNRLVNDSAPSASISSSAEDQSTRTLLAAVSLRIADPQSWCSTALHPMLSEDLLPSNLQSPAVDFSVLPPTLLTQVRQSVLEGVAKLLTAIVEATRSDLVETFARLLSSSSLRPTTFASTPELKASLQRTSLSIIDTLRSRPEPLDLLSSVLSRCTTFSSRSNHMDEDSDPLLDLVGELVGTCGQQMSSNPTVLTETQDRTLVSASSFLSLLFVLNSTRSKATRLPIHAFYCTVLDLAPFLEHFVHYAASLVRSSSAATATPAAGMAEYNVCRSPFLLSLGAKVRLLQLENEIRLSKTPPLSRGSSSVSRFGTRDAELVILPNSMNLKVQREKAWDQSRDLFLQLLENTAGEKLGVRGLRVEFAGEQAADGGGPAREWFATVAHTWDYRKVVGSAGWFIPFSSTSGSAHDDEEEKEVLDTAAFLGLLLALAALHTTKLALPFTLPA